MLISTNPNFLTGTVANVAYHSFFSFALGAAAAVSAYSSVLTLKAATTVGLPSLLTLFDVDASLLQLDADRHAANAAGQALFADLESGTSYGSYAFIQPTVIGDTVSIQLNQAFLNSVNSDLLTNFSIGGTLTPAVPPCPNPPPGR